MTSDAQRQVHRGPVSRPPARPGARKAGPRRSAPEGRKAAPRRAAPGAHAAERRPLPVWQEMGLLLSIALVLAVVIKAFFMQAFYIPSGSMNDTLVLDDRILVQKVSYWAGDVERGDVVVFSDPGGWLGADEVASADNPMTRGLELFGLYPTGGHLVKRVIGVGGDRVTCCDKRGRVRVNETPLDELSYLAEGEEPSLIEFDVQVPEGHLWVQGDNRSNSADSRVHLGDPGGGFIPVEDVVGKVLMVVWPWSHATMIERPATFDDVEAAP